MRAATNGLLAAFGALAFGALVLAQSGQDDASRATSYLEQITGAPYTEWPFEPGVPGGYYVGQEPHGMILRTFVNDVALQDVQGDATTFSEGAILVKENHMPGDVDVASMEMQAPVEGFEGSLAALTFMVKVPGYNPDAGDWFWAKTQPDGTIDAAGTPDGCIACHRGAEGNDWVFNADLSGD